MSVPYYLEFPVFCVLAGAACAVAAMMLIMGIGVAIRFNDWLFRK
jgi:hypothetical protein